MLLGYHLIALSLRRPLTAAFRIEPDGWERIPVAGGAVLAANHDSVIDPFFLPIATRRVVHFMAKAELFRWPLVRGAMLSSGTFPVERGAADGSAIARGVDLLRRGELVAVFPQGTCLPYRERPWRRGAARLSLEASVPLVPIGLVGTERVVRPHSVRLGWSRVRIRVGEPLEPEGTATELTERLEAAVEELRRPFGPPAHVWIEGAAPRRR